MIWITLVWMHSARTPTVPFCMAAAVLHDRPDLGPEGGPGRKRGGMKLHTSPDVMQRLGGKLTILGHAKASDGGTRCMVSGERGKKVKSLRKVSL